MARERNKLTALEIDAYKRKAKTLSYLAPLSDGGGLYIRASDYGKRMRWVYRFVRDGKATEIGLGAVDAVSLQRARDKRDELEKQVEQGRNPLIERKRVQEEERQKQREQANRKTFEQVARAVIKDRAALGASSRASWERGLFTYCKKIADINVDEITTADVIGVITPLVEAADIPREDGRRPTGYTTARRMVARIATVLGYAIAMGWQKTANVAAWENFKHVMPKARKNGDETHNAHHPMLPWEEAPAAVARLRESQAMSARCMEMVALTALRLTEARAAKWTEFDFNTATWTVPASRMKRRVMFKVPLSDRASALIEELKAHRRPGPDVFPGDERKPVSGMAVWVQCRRVTGDQGSPHGWRATFRSWCADHGIDDGVAEACLSHGPGDATKAAYNRAEMVARRRTVMQEWANYLDGKEAESKVLPFSGRRA
jgi:integrase